MQKKWFFCLQANKRNGQRSGQSSVGQQPLMGRGKDMSVPIRWFGRRRVSQVTGADLQVGSVTRG